MKNKKKSKNSENSNSTKYHCDAEKHENDFPQFSLFFLHIFCFLFKFYSTSLSYGFGNSKTKILNLSFINSWELS